MGENSCELLGNIKTYFFFFTKIWWLLHQYLFFIYILCIELILKRLLYSFWNFVFRSATRGHSNLSHYFFSNFLCNTWSFILFDITVIGFVSCLVFFLFFCFCYIILMNMRFFLFRFEGLAFVNQQRGKALLVSVVVMSDLIIFLQENNQKYIFVSPDSKVSRTCPVICNINFLMLSIWLKFLFTK